jgi:AP-2 complex subunit alpha
MAASQPRGLHNFILDIRNAPSKEEERIRVDKELANIRGKFSSSSTLNSYQKKKYVWKMCYIFMLGYEVDFGHMEIISLLSSPKFQEKSVGYMGVSLLLRPGDEMMTLVINSMRNDIIGHLHYGTTLALAAVANIGGDNLAEALCTDVCRLVTTNPSYWPHFKNSTTAVKMSEEKSRKSAIKKKSMLCLLRLFRTNPECIDLDDWAVKVQPLLEDKDIGCVNSAMSLLLGFAAVDQAAFESCVPFVINILNRLVMSRQYTADYSYYQIPSPWLLVKCMRFLQKYPPTTDDTMLQQLHDVIRKLIAKGDDTGSSNNKSNADHSVLFEAINLIISYGADANAEIKEQVMELLGRFLAHKEANIRYLGLSAMSTVARTDGPGPTQEHQDTVLESLKDSDESVRRRALDLLYAMTDQNNSKSVVGELLLNLSLCAPSMKDNMVVKIAILAEKYASDLQWYFDTMVQVIMVAGDHVSEDVWHRIVRIVTNNPDLHEYAAEKMMGIVQSKFAHEIAVSLGGYLLGEFGVNVCEKEGMSGYEQFAALQQHFTRVSPKVKSLLLTVYVKIMNLYPDCKDVIMEVFQKHSTSGHLELQQRSCEYLHFPDVGAELMESVLNTMPVYAEDKENPLLAKAVITKEDQTGWQSEKTRGRSNTRNDDDDEEEEEEEEDAAEIDAPVDLLSLGEEEEESAEGLLPEIIPHMKKWFNSCVIAASGAPTVLFENNLMKIVVSSQYRAHQTRMTLMFNSISEDITNFSATVSNVDYARVQKQDPSSRISMADQTKLDLFFECMRPFSEVPDLTVSFSVGQRRYSYPMKLPLTASAFFEPVTLDKANYMTRWKALEGGEQEQQEVFLSNIPITPNFVNAVRSKCIPGLKLGVATGLDTELTVTACCSFRTGTAAPDGSGNISIGALMRIEGDAASNRFRITVRAKHPQIAIAIKNIVKSQLS